MNNFIFQITRTFVQAATSSFSYVIANQMFNTRNRGYYTNNYQKKKTHQRTHHPSIDYEIHKYQIEREKNKRYNDQLIRDVANDLKKESSDYLPSSFVVLQPSQSKQKEIYPDKKKYEPRKTSNNSLGLVDRIFEKNNIH